MNKIEVKFNKPRPGLNEIEPPLNNIDKQPNKTSHPLNKRKPRYPPVSSPGVWVTWIKYPRIRVLCRMQGARIYVGTEYAETPRWRALGR